MATSSLASPISDDTSLVELVKLLRKASDTSGQISIPKALDSAISRRIQRKPKVQRTEVAGLVEAIDVKRSSSCARLSVRSFIIVFAILRAAEECWELQRGLCLLTESFQIRDLLPSTTQLSKPSREDTLLAVRKSRIGAEILTTLFNHFFMRDLHEGTRRWMGLLAQELLRDSNANKQLLEIGPEERRRTLGNMVLDEESHILRLIAGSIIREMISSGMPEEIFWPIDTHAGVYAGFPKSQHHSSQWVGLFESYLDDLHSQMKKNMASFVHFAHAFQLDNTRYSVENEAAILVTVHDLLSIVIPASNLRPAQYFDIPLPNITEIIINESNDPTQSSFKTQLVKVALFVRLSSAGGHTLFQNALGQMIPEIGLAFDDITTAEDLKTSIMHSNSHHSRSSGYVMHQEDVSSGLIAEGDGDGRDPPASNDLSTLDELTTIASLATNILPTYHLEMTESFERGHLPKLSQLSKGVENHSTRRSTAESPLDADPSINESSSSANADPTRSGESSRLVGTLLSKFNEPLEIESTFSAQWQRGIATIDRAPEFQDIHHSTLRETHTSIPQKLALELKSLPEDDVRTHKILTPSNDALVKSKSPSEEAATLQVEKNHRLTGRTSETNYLLSHEHNTGSIKVTQRMRDREGEQVGSAASQDGKSRTIARVAKIKTSRSNVSGRPQSPSKAQPKAVKKPQPKEKSKGLKPLVEANPASNDEQSTLYDIPDSPPSKRPVSAAARGKKRVAPRAKLAGEKAASTTKESKQAHSTSSAPPRLKDKPLQDESINENDKIVQDPNGINGLGIGEAVQETHVPPDSISKDAQRNTTISSSKTKQKQSHKVQPSLSNIGVRMPKKTKAKGRNDKRESAPSALTRPGSRRTAALHANLKIQGLAVADDTQEELALATVGSEADLVEMFSQEASDIHNPSKTEQKSASDGAAASHLSKKPAGLCHEEYTKPISGEQIESGNGVTTVRDPGDLKAQVELKTPDVVTIGKPSLNGHVNDDVYIERPIPSEVVHIDTTGDPRNVHGIPGRYGIDKKQETTNHISEKKLDQSSLDMPIDHPVRTEVGGEHSSGPAEQVDQYFENAMVFFDDEEIRAPVEQEAPPVLPLPSNEDIDSILEPNQADHELAGSRPKQFDSTTVAEPIRSAVAMHPDLSMVSTKASGIGDPLAARLNGALSGLKDFGDQRDSLEAKRYTNPQSISAVSAGRLPRATLNSDRMGRTSVGGAQKPGYWKDKGINKGKHRESPLLRPARAANESQALEEGPNKITGVNRPIQAALGNRNLQSQKGEVISISSDKDDSSESLPENGTHEGSTLIALPKASRKRKSNESLDDIQKKIRTVPPRPMKTITPSKEAAIGGGAEKEVQELRAFNLVHRKSAVISFSAQGPRNQGVLSADMSARHSNKSIQDLSESAIKPGLFVERKRTIAKISGPTTKVTTPSEKRRRTIVSVPWTHHGNPPTISDRNTGSLIGSSGPLMIRPVEKPNSQSSRVDGNGSPQPSLYHIRRVSTTGLNIQQMITMLGSAEKSSKIMRNKKDEDVALVIQGNIEGPELDLPELREKPSPMAMSHDPIHSSIRKLLPSSPTAPSRMLEELTAHRVHPSGKFVNLQTDCIIRPAMPQDPFTGATKDRPSTFMQLLRASNAYIDQHVTKTGEVKNHVDPKVTIKSPPREDPDRTMVESEIEQDSRQSSPSLCSTTSDQRFQGRDVPPPSDPSDDDDGAAEAGRQWREALRPHQRGNLDALNDITNRLVRHLVDKETAVESVVKDYERSGTMLIDQLATAHDGDLKDYKARVSDVKRRLATSFRGAEEGLARNMKEIKKKPLTDVSKQCRTDQQRLQSQLDAALLACGE